MQHIWFILAAASLLLCLVISLQFYFGTRQIRRLVDFEPPPNDRLPRLSVIVPARNEQRHIEAALESLLKQDYANLELIVVNDRSTDRTGQILDAFAATHPRLNVVHLSELPAGWLGKNHAMHCGTQQASGQWLLFTDADVVMEPTTLRRAVGFAEHHNIDHLPMIGEIRMPNLLLESFVVMFIIYFFTYFRPWKAKDPDSRAYIGVGAFNLIRASVYHDIGTLQRIAMRPDDDVKLGKLVKTHGFRQELLDAVDLMYVPWYGSLREVVVGLEKNAFSGVDYSVLTVIAASLTALIFNVLPFIAVFVTSGIARLLYAATVLTLLWLCWITAAAAHLRRRSAILFPIVVVLFIFIQWRAMLLAFFQQGIRWRDTHYSLKELKSNKV
jgi:glycosyltransferase involved in cell wall biosynthesis